MIPGGEQQGMRKPSRRRFAEPARARDARQTSPFPSARKGTVPSHPAGNARASVSLAAYDVHFHACGNTMDALGRVTDDLYDFAQLVQIGVDDLMQLQEQGLTHVAW